MIYLFKCLLIGIKGGYAVVGAAAFSAAVTHTVSVGVIALEMTGQITHLVPVMIAILIANATAALLQPSLYDSFILIKKLPYLPDFLPSASGMYNIMVEDFMHRDVQFIWQTISYQSLKNVLKKNKRLRSFPLVDSPENMILLGSIGRVELIKIINKHTGRDRRLEVAAKWKKEEEHRPREEHRIRTTRFEVEQHPNVVKLRELANNEMLPPQAKKTKETLLHPNLNISPMKSILKKTHSFSFRRHSIVFSMSATMQDKNENDKNHLENRLFGDSTGNDDIAEVISFGPYVSKKVHLVCIWL